nr:amidase [Roseospira visakhapatnamensis]
MGPALRALAEGRVTATALTEAALDRARTVGARLNAVMTLDETHARAAAAENDALPPDQRGALHGLPLAHKDIFHRAGRRTTLGSRARDAFVPARSSVLIERLEAAGSVTLGGLHTAEFAMGPTGHNEHYGRCRNPWNPDLITGGSSSGSGAAVAARLVFAALGSDTGGSVRLPAAICGVTGLKPTQGRLDTAGMMGLSASLDCPGILARGAEDVARVMDVVDTHPPPGGFRAALDHGEARLSGLTLGLPDRYYLADLDPEVAARFSEAIRVFEGLGARVIAVVVPDHESLADLADLTWTPEAAAQHLPGLRAYPEQYGRQVRARLLQGLVTPAVFHLQARKLRAHYLRAMVEGPLSACNALVTPALAITTPTAAEMDVGAGAAMRETLARITRQTRPLSYLGLPGVVTPMGRSSNGGPTALQIIGRPFDEAALLRVSHAFETRTRWLNEAPPMAM